MFTIHECLFKDILRLLGAGRNPQMNRRDCGEGSPLSLVRSLALHSSHLLLQDWTVAWLNPDLLEEGESTLLAGEGNCRA